MVDAINRVAPLGFMIYQDNSAITPAFLSVVDLMCPYETDNQANACIRISRSVTTSAEADSFVDALAALSNTAQTK
jgi:hypothetical protein